MAKLLTESPVKVRRPGRITGLAALAAGALLLSSCQAIPPAAPPSGAATGISAAPVSSGVVAPASGSAPGVAPGGPQAPKGAAIASVSDYQLPSGLGAWQPPDGGSALALDDVTADIYFAGVPVNTTSGEPTQQDADSVYRYDPVTRQATKVAGLSMPTAAIYGLAATNGWVFWGEVLDSPDDPSKSRSKCFAAKSDGSQVSTLADVPAVKAEDGGWVNGLTLGCGFAAGGGKALWFGVNGAVNTANAFDTATAQSVTILEPAPLPGYGAIHGDTALLLGANPSGSPASSTVLAIQVSTGKQTELAGSAPQFGMSGEAVGWMSYTETTSDAHGCIYTAPVSCPTPVELGTWSQPISEGQGLVGVVGRYVALVPPHDSASLTLINVAKPSEQTPIPGGTLDYSVGGRRMGTVWSAQAVMYLRVVTVAS